MTPHHIRRLTALRRGGIVLDQALIAAVAATIFSMGIVVILLILALPMNLG